MKVCAAFGCPQVLSTQQSTFCLVHWKRIPRPLRQRLSRYDHDRASAAYRDAHERAVESLRGVYEAGK